jgi:hypothetical protein
VPRQDLEGHAPAQRDLLGLVDHAHAAPADLAQDPVVAHLAQRWQGDRGRGGGMLRLVLLGALDLDQGREELADLVGQLGAAVDVLLQAGPLPAPEPRGELLGQLVEPTVIRGARVRGHGSDPFVSTRHRRQDFFEPF